MQQIYSITDKPITSINENLLGIEGYAKALSKFIIGAATPLTIGMQGEWGTGKTSLMYLVREHLEKDVATSWVNTWEYSLFKGAEETTPAVLKGLLENLIIHCKQNNYWPEEKAWEEKKRLFTKGLKVVGKLAAKIAVNKVTGEDVDINFESPDSLRSEIAEVKAEIQALAKIIVESPKNPYKRIVFFVDDLDRLEPSCAVEILEALKNIFDIDHCVFVLAIDYDVVIKGLEKKFGKKTEENEREFRSFFDKIIQVPFTMPTGAYKIETLIESKLNEIGVKLSPSQQKDFVKIVKLTVGYIPRSIKRFINSYSLLKNIRLEGHQDDVGTVDEDLCLFALLGIQISYPHVFRLINRRHDFEGWNESFAKSLGIDEIKVPDEEHEFLDEKWEQILWCYCQRDPYLRARALSIIEILNFLRSRLGANLLEVLEGSMEFASMTSVDDSVETKQTKTRGPVRKDDEVTAFFEKVRQRLSGMIESKMFPDKWSRWAGTGPEMRYYHLWYKRPGWDNHVLSFRVWYYEPECRYMPGDQFIIFLGVDKKYLTVEPAKVQNLLDGLKPVELPGFQVKEDDTKIYIEMPLANCAFSDETAETIATKLATLIKQTKPVIDGALGG